MEIWEMTLADLPKYQDCIPKRQTPLTAPSSYSEADLHAHSLHARLTETVPPQVQRYPIGTWVASRHSNHLWGNLQASTGRIAEEHRVFQLLRMPLDCLRVRETWPRPTETVHKYARWHEEGSLLPPIRVIEMPADSGVVMEIDDGHHRYDAAMLLGHTHIDAWVSYGVAHQEYGFEMLYSVTYEYMLLAALRLGFDVPNHVLDAAPEVARAYFESAA